MKNSLVIILLLLSRQNFAQQHQQLTDSATSLSEIVIKGYESDRRLLESPVSAGVLGTSDMQRFSTVSLLPAVNLVPGVRMEERSPGSYRLSIRGSLLRSPFGVRNIKVYWDDIPFTDAGGNTYFNLVDQNSIRQVEILKGPGSSIYGANTGGVVILHSDEPGLTGNNETRLQQLKAGISAGSYGLFAENAQWKYADNRFTSSVTQSHLQSDGYRQNSRLRKDVLQWNGATALAARDRLSWVMLYADIYYQTPGGLTLRQMTDDPRQARPSTPVQAGAVAQKAAIYNKTPFVGLSNRYDFDSHWSNTTSGMFSYTDFTNPFLTNYEKRSETNLGLRTKFVYHNNFGKNDVRITAGLEWQYNYSAINNYGNKGGVPDTVQYRDKLWARQFFPFLQAEWGIGKNLLLQAGSSTNDFVYHYQRLTNPGDPKSRNKLDHQVLPRLALLYRITSEVSFHTSMNKGFSPPSIAEIRPSGGIINNQLQPESGWNYEAGFRGSLLKERLQFDITGYLFKLQDAIVRKTINDNEYFINAGGTDQKGLEVYADYSIFISHKGFLRSLKVWGSLTQNDFRFSDYSVNDKSYSGNALTGVAKNITSFGFDLITAPGLYLNAGFTYTSALPLNDDNSFYASPYRLLSGKMGWTKKINALSLSIFAGIDNALDQLYSLGNDLNAFGNRFYNPAAGRNYTAGISVAL